MVLKMDEMIKLTAKEEEIMNFFWDKGALYVRDLLQFYSNPKPHFNTLSTIVRGLEEKGFLSHRSYGNTFQYYPVISREMFGNGTLKSVINKYYNSSVLSAVSGLVEREEITLDDLKELISRVESSK